MPESFDGIFVKKTEVEEVPSILLPCVVCGRTFRPEALSKHTNVCERQHAKKRKKFDSAKQRIQGTELAEFLGPPPVPNKPRPKPPSPKKAQSRWKEKHEALVRTIRDEQTKPLDHEQCPHCDRYFGPKAFDRHVAWCKDQHSKIPAQSEDKDKSIAKQRLDARIKYRAPSIRSQRSVTKEKYSSHRPGGGNLTTSVSSLSSSAAQSAFPSLPRSNSISHSTSETGAYGGEGLRKLPVSKLSRQNSLNRTTKKDEPTKSHHESIPPLKNNRIGLQSSKPSEARSISSPSFHTSGPGDIMSTSLHQDIKPTIKPSLSTNRKGKRDETGENKRWKRHHTKGSEDKRSVVRNPNTFENKDMGEQMSHQPSDPSKPSRKLWTRLKAKTLSSTSIVDKNERKGKKVKGKKKIRIVSSAKSSSSRKTITLSGDGLQCELQQNLEELKLLNAEEHIDETVNKEMSPCFDESSDFLPNPYNDLENFLSIEDSMHQSSSLGNLELQDEKVNMISALEIRPLLSEDQPEENCVINNMIDPLDVQSFDNVASLDDILNRSSNVQIATTIEPNVSQANQKASKGHSDLSIKSSTKPCKIRRKKSNQIINNFVKNDPTLKSEDSAVPFIQIFDKRGLVEQNEDQKTEVIKLVQTDLNIEKLDEKKDLDINVVTNVVISAPQLKTISENDTADNASNFKPVMLKMLEDGVTPSTSNSNLRYFTPIVIEPSKSSLLSDENGSDDMARKEFAEVSIDGSRSNIIMKKFSSVSVVEKCECRKLFSTIKHQLQMLSRCKCMVHQICESSTANMLHMTNSDGLYRQLPQGPDESSENLCKVKQKLNSSYSDPGIYFSDPRNDSVNLLCSSKPSNFNKSNCGFSKVKLIKRNLSCAKSSILLEATTQTSNRNTDISCSNSENGSVYKHSARINVDEKDGWEACRNLANSNQNHAEGSECGSISRSMNCGRVGQRLRDVRRLLSRNSVDRQSNSSISVIDEDPNSTIGSNKEIFELDESSGRIETLHCESNNGFSVIMTSMKRLPNPREKLNKRLALRERQLAQTHCSTNHRIIQPRQTLNGEWRIMEAGDYCFEDFPSAPPLHLPPLGNSTPKCLNRRWSPSGDQNSGGVQNDDPALSKFCHECGGRYPVAGAKFCCLCGVRRLAI